MAGTTREFIATIYMALVRLHFKQCSVLGPQYKKNVELLEHGQRRAIKLVKGLGNKDYEEELREMGLEERRMRKTLSLSTNTWKEIVERGVLILFSR